MATKSAFMDNLKQLFADCDSDQSGSLGRDEFKELCKRIGLDMEAAEETFERLDVDKNEQITFDEFVAGFQQYSKQSIPGDQANSRNDTKSSQENSKTQQQQQQRLTPAARSRARTSPTNTPAAGVLSLGASSSSSASSSDKTRRPTNQSSSSSSGSSFNVTQSSSSQSSSFAAPAGNDSVDFVCSPQAIAETAPAADDVVVYDSDVLLMDHQSHGAFSHEQNSQQSGQFGSMLSTASSLTGASYSQVKTMQDLLDCVQKLQNENQVLSQIFFKDKRERDEYISQLGEEFDQQLRDVEERANRRAREELEAEKKRLSDMMQTERETLQHHYTTLERIGKLVKSPNGTSVDGLTIHDLGLGGSQLNGSHRTGPSSGESIELVKTQLEGTFEENRQLKRSLLDTKTDVALIWKEMEKLKKQYEEKLSSAYEKHKETQHECDHIKQQLSLMKDSNRKLQDASDVITHYIADKVEPVIKVASGCNLSGEPGELDMVGANSRRGSILSEYLGNNDDCSDDCSAEPSPLNMSIDDQRKRPSQEEKKSDNFLRLPSLQVPAVVAAKLRPTTTAGSSSSRTSSEAGAAADDAASESSASCSSGSSINFAKNKKNLPAASSKSLDTNGKSPESSGATKSENHREDQLLQQPSTTLRNFGRNLLLGSRAQSNAKARDAERLSSAGGGASSSNSKSLAAKLQDTKSASADQAEEPAIEPADGPSKATFNIILVGDSFVGKSSFAARFIEGSFVQGLISNCSIDFKTKSYKVDRQNYTVNLWDTAGQERFRSITASYFRKADGIILMYDVTDKRSYLNVRNWMSTISDTAAENVAVLLVGNKIDLRHNDNKTKCVPTEEGFRLAKEYDIMFLETSVKTGTNLLPSMGRLIRLIAKKFNADEEDKDRIRLSDKNRSFNCMPKNC